MSDVTAAVARALDRGLGADEHLVVLGAGSADLADDARAAGLVATHGRHRVWAAPPGTAGALCGLAVGAARAGVRPVVLHPPAVCRGGGQPWDERENGFLCLGRIAPEKEIERVIAILDRVRETF
ncbi:MAG: hypothetical protein M0T71_15445, partial [Actinomycetota bacterium]|nr:hypothetical protein [Actinomycetota bacterium]